MLSVLVLLMPPLACPPLLFPKVGAAATFSDLSGQHPSGNHTTQADNVEGEGEEEGVEPRLAKLDDANNAHSGLHHPSSVVARDTDVRGPSTLGRDSAATLLQSRFRGYHLRKGGGIGGRGSNKMVATISRSGGGTSCSVLDLEVRDNKVGRGRGIRRSTYLTSLQRLNLVSEQQPQCEEHSSKAYIEDIFEQIGPFRTRQIRVV